MRISLGDVNAPIGIVTLNADGSQIQGTTDEQAIFNWAGLTASQIYAATTQISIEQLANTLEQMQTQGETPTQAAQYVASLAPSGVVGAVTTVTAACTDSIGCLSIAGMQIPETPLLIAAAVVLAFVVFK
jgi:hypothetical protein